MVQKTERWREFRPCPQCGYDFATGEGERGCSWGECPYLPEELDVFCDYCRFDFLTMEGNSSCEDPATCAHGVEPRANVEHMRSWMKS